MPIILSKNPVPIVYERNGVSISFSPVGGVEALAHKQAMYKKMSAPEEWGFDELLAIKMQPVRLAASKCISISGIKIDDGTELNGAVSEEEAIGYLCQLIDLQEFGDLYAFLETMADGQKKTLLTM